MSLCCEKYDTGLGCNDDSTDGVEPNPQGNGCLPAQQMDIVPTNQVNLSSKSKANIGEDQEGFKSFSSNSNNARFINEPDALFMDQLSPNTHVGYYYCASNRLLLCAN